jgi:hypothetical protein
MVMVLWYIERLRMNWRAVLEFEKRLDVFGATDCN